MLNLHAIYEKQNNGKWLAFIEDYPFILVENMPCLESAKEILIIYIAEEIFEKYKPKRCNWAIYKETILSGE